MRIVRNSQSFVLTAAELEAAYRERERQYMLDDAAKALATRYGIDPDDNPDDNPGAYQLFADTFGFSFDEACNNSSEYYLLNRVVDCFNKDCNVPDNVLWENAVHKALQGIVTR